MTTKERQLTLDEAPKVIRKMEELPKIGKLSALYQDDALPPEQDLKALIRQEHLRAELQRLNDGKPGCGCADCQELYKTLDLAKYGRRVSYYGDIIIINEKKLQESDRWTSGGGVFVHYGKRYSINSTGKTICLGPVGDTDRPKESKVLSTLELALLDCPSSERCSAPICPLDPASLKNGIWYPDEQICSGRKQKEKWMRIQKRIAKKAKNIDRYFTLKDFLVTRVRNPRGHDPDANYIGSSNKRVITRAIKNKRASE